MRTDRVLRKEWDAGLRKQIILFSVMFNYRFLENVVVNLLNIDLEIGSFVDHFWIIDVGRHVSLYINVTYSEDLSRSIPTESYKY